MSSVPSHPILHAIIIIDYYYYYIVLALYYFIYFVVVYCIVLIILLPMKRNKIKNKIERILVIIGVSPFSVL